MSYNSFETFKVVSGLDLVSLGTICDVVPLIGLNRALVTQGLKILKKKSNQGIKILKDICGIDSNLNTYHLGYIIGPRINAGGRVGKSSHGANLLLNHNPKEAFKIATELDQFNKERQLLEKDLTYKVLNEIKNGKFAKDLETNVDTLKYKSSIDSKSSDEISKIMDVLFEKTKKGK